MTWDYTTTPRFDYATFDDVQIVPRLSDIKSRSNADEVSINSRFTRNHFVTNPLVAAPMNTVCGYDMARALLINGGVGAIHRFLTIDEQKHIIHALSKNFINYDSLTYPRIYCASVGVNGDSAIRADALIEAGANVILIDVAHGHHTNVRDMIKYLKNKYPKIDIIAGNIATAVGYADLVDWGADAVRVGVGGGSVCETRIRTGVGVPQFTAICECAEYAEIHDLDVPIIADGGIRYPGDVAKALAAGAETVMIGSLFAGTDEAPGETLVAGKWPYVRHQKIYRGSASATAKLQQFGHANHVEGATKIIDAKGPVENIINDIIDGVTSCMSYVGAHNLKE